MLSSPARLCLASSRSCARDNLPRSSIISVQQLRLLTGARLLSTSVNSSRPFECVRSRIVAKTWATENSLGSNNSVFSSARSFRSSAVARHGSITRPEPGTGITINFTDSKGALIKTVEVNEDDDVLSIAHEHDIDLEGACEASLACSTCHVILSPEHYDLLPEPSDDENDMLDLAFGLTDTSRLGCQVHITKDMEGMNIQLPSATRNMFVDGHKPTHH